MKCYVCNGTGKRFVPTNKNAITGNGYTADCLICNGTGKLVLTNEKWLNSLSINERADEIIGYIANTIGLARYYNDDDVAEFVEWLKEEHK